MLPQLACNPHSYTEMVQKEEVPGIALYVLILWCGFKNEGYRPVGTGPDESGLLDRALLASFAG